MARATGTATSRRAALGLTALGLAVAGCGGSSQPAGPSAARSPAPSSQRPGDGARGGFAWLRPGPAPRGWRTVTITSRATMAYPPGWHQVAGDAGTATAVLPGAGREFLGYLNLTPRQGDETLANWSSFRVAHNAHEGDRQVTRLAAARGLRFRNGHGACVRDAYTTATGVRYIELACLVGGPRATSVIVGAAPPQAWAQTSPSIERAISAFTT